MTIRTKGEERDTKAEFWDDCHAVLQRARLWGGHVGLDQSRLRTLELLESSNFGFEDLFLAVGLLDLDGHKLARDDAFSGVDLTWSGQKRKKEVKQASFNRLVSNWVGQVGVGAEKMVISSSPNFDLDSWRTKGACTNGLDDLPPTLDQICAIQHDYPPRPEKGAGVSSVCTGRTARPKIEAQRKTARGRVLPRSHHPRILPSRAPHSECPPRKR